MYSIMNLPLVPHSIQVNAVRVDDVQGKEYRALLISTVRTCTSDPEAEDFLTNEKVKLNMQGVLYRVLLSHKACKYFWLFE